MRRASILIVMNSLFRGIVVKKFSSGNRRRQFLEDETYKSHLDDPSISLYAITGISHVQTMQVTRYIHEQPIRVLIDSGSTHCFIDFQLASKLNLKIVQRYISVKVADGNRLHALECVQRFRYR